MSSDPFVTVVSGLPRSGTSMMMRCLEAGGIPPISDGQRTADEDNPHGYFELEVAKQIKRDDSFLDRANGKSVKLIHLLITSLPVRHNYRVLLMRRSIDEVLASQAKMLARSGKKGGSVSSDALKKVFSKQLADVQTWLSTQPNVELLDVDYQAVIADPLASMTQIEQFLGGDLDVTGMASAVDPSLYRNRS